MKRHNDKIQKTLEPLLWDYSIEPEDFFSIARGEMKLNQWQDQEWALLRILERLGWYELLDLFGLDFIKENLTPDRIAKLRFREMRDRYELIRKLLHGESVSFSGWNSETRERFTNTLLSHRWYRSEPALSQS